VRSSGLRDLSFKLTRTISSTSVRAHSATFVGFASIDCTLGLQWRTFNNDHCSGLESAMSLLRRLRGRLSAASSRPFVRAMSIIGGVCVAAVSSWTLVAHHLITSRVGTASAMSQDSLKLMMKALRRSLDVPNHPQWTLLQYLIAKTQAWQEYPSR